MRRIWIVGILVVVFVGGYLLLNAGSNKEEQDLFVNVKRGDFQIDIVTTGELEAKNFVKVQGPSGLRAARLWNVKIEDMVPEGTVVKKGQYIARLDRSELSDRLKNEESDFQQSQSQYTQTKIDTALTLRSARDDLKNLEFAVEERKIEVEQSQYEPPATIKQAEINLEKARRSFTQAKEAYKLKKRKAVAQMQEAAAKLREDRADYEFLQQLARKFIIMAPEPGMVIYEREFNGRKKEVGSTIGAWDPTVATLPDLTSMLSKTYVNEVDIRKVKVGQQVDIGLDAFPDKKLSGKVTSVANVGEQLPNADAKVFEVVVEVDGSDTTLRPAMTTSNTIIADVIPNVLHVPLESLHSLGDSVTYVYKVEGIATVRQEVQIGKTNTNNAIIVAGLSEGDRIYLSTPAEGEEKTLRLLEGSEAKNEEGLSLRQQ